MEILSPKRYRRADDLEIDLENRKSPKFGDEHGSQIFDSEFTFDGDQRNEPEPEVISRSLEEKDKQYRESRASESDNIFRFNSAVIQQRKIIK